MISYLLRGIIKSENLLVVDIQDIFNMNAINYDSAKEFERNE